MKTTKLSLNSIKNVLSRAEMKKIMAGSSCDGGPCVGGCPNQSGCYCYSPPGANNGVCGHPGA